MTVAQASDELHAVLAVAAAQLELALREAAGPVEALGRSLERLGIGVAQLRGALPATAAISQHATCRELSYDLSVCAESLQFYDRLVQHLAHLREFLLGLSGSPDAAGIRGHEQTSWEDLRARLHRCLISEGQRELLDLILPSPHLFKSQAGDGHSARRMPLHVEEGSIELF
jgi:hypothetical protein